MPNQLKKLVVDWISLVKSPANRRNWTLKDDDSFRVDFPFEKITKNESSVVVTGVVYAPNEVDTDGDFADPDTIRRAAFDFMKGLKAGNVDVQHSFKKADGVDFVESWVGEDGAWRASAEISDPEIIKQVNAGNLTGFSMAGQAQRIQKAESAEESAKRTLGNWIWDAVMDRVESLNKLIGIDKSAGGSNNPKKEGEDMELTKENLEAIGGVIKTQLETFEQGLVKNYGLKKSEGEGDDGKDVKAGDDPVEKRFTSIESTLKEVKDSVQALAKERKTGDDPNAPAGGFEEMLNDPEQLIKFAGEKPQEYEKLQAVYLQKCLAGSNH